MKLDRYPHRPIVHYALTVVVRAPFALGILAGLAISASAVADDGFSLGIAAGDVRDTSAIIWTRADEPGSVRYQVATDTAFNHVIEQGIVAATIDNDRIAMIELDMLSPATDYVYRFLSEAGPGIASAVGHFRTAPTPSQGESLRFVFTGDTNIAFAPFALADDMAQEDADFLLWFGDTIYADDESWRTGAATTLEEYREKYREIRRDPFMRVVLARLPIWVGWDDHEVKDDFAGTDPMIPPQQLDAAYRAFFEYMPIRKQSVDGDPYRVYRRFRWGANVEFFLTDARQYRDVSASEDCDGNVDPLGSVLGPLLADSACDRELSGERTMLGKEQFAWLTRGLLESPARVKFVVNGVPISYLGIQPYDRWDGYDGERRALLEFIDANRISGVVFLTTDFHSNWYNPDLTSYFRERRPDYDLSNGVPVAEAIVGPLGIETMYESFVETVTHKLGAAPRPLMQFLLDGIEHLLTGRLRRISGFTLSETNRRSYAVIDVSAEGKVKITYRGADPKQATDPNVVAETFFSSEDSTLAATPCFVPVFLAGLAGWAAVSSRRRR